MIRSTILLLAITATQCSCVNIHARSNNHFVFRLVERKFILSKKPRLVIIKNQPSEDVARKKVAERFGAHWLSKEHAVCTPLDVDPQQEYVEYVP